MKYELEPWEPEMELLLRRARVREKVPPEVQARMWARLAPYAAGQPSTSQVVKKQLRSHPWSLATASAGVGAALALGGALFLQRSFPPRVVTPFVNGPSAPAPAAVVPAVAPAPQVAAPTPVPSQVAPLLRTATGIPVVRVHRPPAALLQPAPVAAAPVAVADAELARERSIVDRAREALARGNAEGALSALSEHEANFPNGGLSAEREALRVRALVQSGRRDEAGTAAQAFFIRFPKSLLKPMVEEALKNN